MSVSLIVDMGRIRPPWALNDPLGTVGGRCHDLLSMTGLLVPIAAKPPCKSCSRRGKIGQSGSPGILEMGRQRDQDMLMVLLENWIMGSGFWNTIAKAYTHG